MPRTGVLLGTGLVSSTIYPYSITIGGVEVAPTKAELQSITFQDNGDDEPGTLSLRLWDSTNTLAVKDQGVINVAEYATGQQVWGGVVQRKSYDPAAVGRYINVEGISFSTLLNEIFIVRETRPAESDRARVLYLWGKYARWPLSTDVSQVTQTAASIAADDILSMTLGSALRFTMALAGSTNRLAIDPLGRLHWFAGTEVAPAPYNVNRAIAPGGGNIAPDAISVERDGTIKNRVYVRGSTSLGSGWYQDDASVAAYGPRETPIDAPSADTAAKALSIARMYFGRVAQPRTRGSFQTEEPYNGWRAGQNVTITDPANDLAAQSFRIARVTTTFTKGTGTRRYKIEFGGVRPRGSDVEDDILGRTLLPGQAVAGDTFDNDGNLLLSGGTAGATGGFGPAIRRYITSGVYNGDFALAPPYPDSSIVEAWNPLPFWTFVQASGTAIKASSVADSASGSGRVLRFDMAAGAAGDDSYIEQLVPVNASRTQSYTYWPGAALLPTPVGSAAEVYIQSQYLTKEQVATGAPVEVSVTTLTVTALYDLAGSEPTPPANAAFLRLRIGYRRAGAATTFAEPVDVAEIRLDRGQPFVPLPDVLAPATYGAGVIRQGGGQVVIAPNIATPTGSSPSLFLDGRLAQGLIYTAQPFRPATNVPVVDEGFQSWNSASRSLYVGDSVRAKPVTPVGFGGAAYACNVVSLIEATNAEVLPINGGSFLTFFDLASPMTLHSLFIRTSTAPGLNAKLLEWALYLDTLNSSATATRITNAVGTFSFVAAASTSYESTVATPPLLAPGRYWLVLRNTSGVNTFGLGTATGTFPGTTCGQIKTLGAALGSTLDLITAWNNPAGSTRAPYMVLTGRILGQATRW